MNDEAFSAHDLDVAKELGVMNGRLINIETLLTENRNDLKDHILHHEAPSTDRTEWYWRVGIVVAGFLAGLLGGKTS